jgi:hypothetical protein
MNRALLLFCILAIGALRAVAIGPQVVTLTTDATGTKYLLGRTEMARPALIEWFAQSKPWGSQPVLISVDASTPLFAVYDFLAALKDRAAVEEFWVTVSSELKGDQRATVTYRFVLKAAQLPPPERVLLPPPDASPEAVIQGWKPWIPPAPKLPPPPTK